MICKVVEDLFNEDTGSHHYYHEEYMVCIMGMHIQCTLGGDDWGRRYVRLDWGGKCPDGMCIDHLEMHICIKDEHIRQLLRDHSYKLRYEEKNKPPEYHQDNNKALEDEREFFKKCGVKVLRR